MIAIAVVNTKGGVGKTTLTTALAVRAAQESERVAVVDFDPQGSLANWWDRRGRNTIRICSATHRPRQHARCAPRARGTGVGRVGLGLHGFPARLLRDH